MVLASVYRGGVGRVPVRTSRMGQHAISSVHLPSKSVSNTTVGIQWGGGIYKQGMPWEDYVGKSFAANARLPQNFKTFDYYDSKSRTAISAKTLDTQTVAKINKPIQVYNAIKTHIDLAANFKQYTLSGVSLRSNMIQSREVHLAISAKTNTEQRQQIQKAINYAKSRNIVIKITEIK